MNLRVDQAVPRSICPSVAKPPSAVSRQSISPSVIKPLDPDDHYWAAPSSQTPLEQRPEAALPAPGASVTRERPPCLRDELMALQRALQKQASAAYIDPQGTPLPAGLAKMLESRWEGFDGSRVRVVVSNSISGLAESQGGVVYLSAGIIDNLLSPLGQEILFHELVHVWQQQPDSTQQSTPLAAKTRHSADEEAYVISRVTGALLGNTAPGLKLTRKHFFNADVKLGFSSHEHGLMGAIGPVSTFDLENIATKLEKHWESFFAAPGQRSPSSIRQKIVTAQRVMAGQPGFGAYARQLREYIDFLYQSMRSKTARPRERKFFAKKKPAHSSLAFNQPDHIPRFGRAAPSQHHHAAPLEPQPVARHLIVNDQWVDLDKIRRLPIDEKGEEMANKVRKRLNIAPGQPIVLKIGEHETPVSPAYVTAMAGDYYQKRSHLENAPPNEIKALKESIQRLSDRALKQLNRSGLWGKQDFVFEAESEKITALRRIKCDPTEQKPCERLSYLDLALINFGHYGEKKNETFISSHREALSLAKQSYDASRAGNASKAAALLNEAFVVEKNGQHYLQDMSSGHQNDGEIMLDVANAYVSSPEGKRAVINSLFQAILKEIRNQSDEFKIYIPLLGINTSKRKFIEDLTSMRERIGAMIGFFNLAGITAQLIRKEGHDWQNGKGLRTRNTQQTWQMMGDDHLFDPISDNQTFSVIRQAVTASDQEIILAAEKGIVPSDQSFAALQFMPRKIFYERENSKHVVTGQWIDVAKFSKDPAILKKIITDIVEQRGDALLQLIQGYTDAVTEAIASKWSAVVKKLGF